MLAAYNLDKQGYAVTLLETSARAGEIQNAQDVFERVSPLTHRVIDYLRQQQRVSLPEE